jgi:hypothetical protein
VSARDEVLTWLDATPTTPHLVAMNDVGQVVTYVRALVVMSYTHWWGWAAVETETGKLIYGPFHPAEQAIQPRPNPPVVLANLRQFLALNESMWIIDTANGPVL